MLDEILLETLDTAIERFTRWSAPWKIRIKRSFIGFRLALIGESMKRTAGLLFNKIKVAGREDGFLQRLISEPVEPVKEEALREVVDTALTRAQELFRGKAFAALLLMVMQCTLLLAAKGTSELAVLAAFFALHWLASALDEGYEPICAGVRQRYLAAMLLRAGGYLTLLLSYFVSYARQGLKINVVLQGAMALTIIVHMAMFLSFVAFNRRQQPFLRVVSGVLGFAPALASAAGIALGASTAAQETMAAAGGVVRAIGVTLAFLAWQVEMIASLGGNRLRFGQLWHGILSTIGFFMMLCGAWLCAL